MLTVTALLITPAAAMTAAGQTRPGGPVMARPAQPATPQPARPGPEFLFFGGVDVGSSPSTEILPLPPGTTFTGPNGRSSQVVPTWLANPGTRLYADVISALGKANRYEPLDDLLATHRFDENPGWSFGARVTAPVGRDRWRASVRYYAEAGLELHRNRRIQIADWLSNVGRTFHDGLFTGATAASVTPSTVERGSHGLYYQTLVSGGLELRRGSFGGDFLFRGGPAFAVPIDGSPAIDLELDYRFTAGGVDFHETDGVALAINRSTGVGFKAATGFRRPMGGHALVLDVTLTGLHRTDEIRLSAAPVSVAGSLRGAAAYNTTPTIVFNTIPERTTSLSGSASDHVFVTVNGFRWSVGFTAGIAF